MESSFLSRLPSIISTKPFYISSHHKPSPFRYRSAKNSSSSIQQTKTMDNSRVSGHEKDLSKLQTLRFYIQHTIQNQKRVRVQSLMKRKEEDDLELERKRERVKEQRRRHQVVMKQMKQYLMAMRKYYWVKNPCPCGCCNGDGEKEETVEQVPQGNQPKKVQYRLNNVNHFKSTNIIPKTLEQPSFPSFSRKITLNNLNSNNTSSFFQRPTVSSQMHQTANSYFSLLSSLQRSVKTHLSSSKGINRLLQQLIIKDDTQSQNLSNSSNTTNSFLKSKTGSSKFQIRKSILNVLSLTKSNWEDIFKNVVALKGLENKLVKIARENNYEVEYTEAERYRKQMMDDMYKQLVDNKQYFKHINKEIEAKGMQNEIRERLQSIQQDNRDKDPDKEAPQGQSKILSTTQHKKLHKSKQISSDDDYFDELQDYYAEGKKAEIHEHMDDIIHEFMRNQNLVKQRKRTPRKTLLESLGIEHMVHRNSSRNNSGILNGGSFHDNKSNGRRSTAVPTFKELVKRSIRLTEMKKMQEKERKPVKLKKKKMKNKDTEGNKIETTEFIEQQKQNPAIEDPPIEHKSKLRRNNDNIMNGIYQKISIPGDQQPQSTLNPLYQKHTIFSDERNEMYNRLHSLKHKKKMSEDPDTRHSQYIFQLINTHENIGIIKTRLFELFKHDDWNNFWRYSKEFLEGQDRMDQNLEKLEKIKIQTIVEDSYNWIEGLDFDIDIQHVDVMDLVINEKIKDPIFSRENERIEDLADFRVEKMMTTYELECHRKRVRAFVVENSYMKHRRQNSSDVEVVQNNQYI